MLTIDEVFKQGTRGSQARVSKPETVLETEYETLYETQYETQYEITPEPTPVIAPAAEPEAIPQEAPQEATEATKAEPQKSSSKQPSILKDFLSLFAKVASIVLIFVILFTFLFGIIRYEDTSMSPSIKDGDLVLFYRYNSVGYLPEDVIALEYNGKKQARRVVAIAGDTVDISEDGLLINGALQYEPDIIQQTERYQDGISLPVTVPEGHIFVLGDGRSGATDSRIYGCVKIEDTFGKVMTVIRRRGI